MCVMASGKLFQQLNLNAAKSCSFQPFNESYSSLHHDNMELMCVYIGLVKRRAVRRTVTRPQIQIIAPVLILLICCFPKCVNDSKEALSLSNRTVIGVGLKRPPVAAIVYTWNDFIHTGLGL